MRHNHRPQTGQQHEGRLMRQGGQDLRGHRHEVLDVTNRHRLIALVDPCDLLFGEIGHLEQTVDVEAVPLVGGDTPC
jgi:hypothetical protein